MRVRSMRCLILAALVAACMIASPAARAAGLATTTITDAIDPPATSTQLQFVDGAPRNLTLQANSVYGSGGTSVDAYVQTTLDGGATWFDIAELRFTTASAIKASDPSVTWWWSYDDVRNWRDRRLLR